MKKFMIVMAMVLLVGCGSVQQTSLREETKPQQKESREEVLVGLRSTQTKVKADLNAALEIAEKQTAVSGDDFERIVEMQQKLRGIRKSIADVEFPISLAGEKKESNLLLVRK